MHRRIKFRHVQAFVEIAKRRSLKNAAEELSLTQPSISKTLKELEEILGARLLNRGRGGVELTSEGEVFLQFAEISLSAMRQGVSGIEQLRHGGQLGLSIGALPSVAALLMPVAARHFRELSPDTLLSVVEGPHDYLLDEMKRGQLDLVVGRLGQSGMMKGFSFTQLYDEAVVCVTRPGNPLAKASTLQELSEALVIYPSEGSAIRALVDRFMIAEGQGQFANRVESVSGAFGLRLTLETDAVWFISQGVVEREILDGTLVKLPIEASLTEGPVGIMARANEEMAPGARLFSRALQKALDEVGL